MQLILHPRYAAGNVVRIWLGVRPVRSAPDVQWTLDGSAVQPKVVFPLQSARDSGLLDADEGRVFAGIYELGGLVNTRTYKIHAAATGSSGQRAEYTLQTRPAPAALPEDGSWLNILLVSCYHYAASAKGSLHAVMLAVNKEAKPSLSILLGDQVYLDLPTLKDFPPGRAPLAARFERDYARNWFDEWGYREVLSAAPSASLPDDHEYWNNFPHRSPIIQNSWKGGDRGEWTAAARRLYGVFQAFDPERIGDELVIDLPPVSIFLADLRSDRRFDRSSLLRADVLARLRAWIEKLNVAPTKQVGVFVSGQSMFDAAAGRFTGNVGDFTLANYDDFPELAEALAAARFTLVFITGDVHWGRVTQIRDMTHENRVRMYELITSPASLVESVGVDQARELKATLGGLFGFENPWPRHSDPTLEAQWQGRNPSRYLCQTRHGQKGDQVAVLSLRQFAGAVEGQVGYFAVHPDPAYQTSRWSKTFNLTSGVSGIERF